MTNPPSTPTPRRFLLPKRQQQTPVPQSRAGPSQFQSTPRFAPSSTPRPSTQGPPVSTLRKTRHQDPINDVLESPPSSPPPATLKGTSDSIEVDSDVATDSQADESDRAPSPKRRRISISGEPEREDNGDGVGNVSVDESLADRNSEDGQASDPEDDAVLPDVDAAESEDAQVGTLVGRDRAVASNQPKFQKAPRFKVSEADMTRQEGLPEAFSPQRRGQRYVADGLAAGLQGWLADVKGWGGSERPSGSVMKVVIDEVRPGNRMYLAKGRKVSSEDDVVSTDPSVAATKLMLAGEGKLTDLGRRADVTVGSTVAISQPAWPVLLEGDDDPWIIACDWAIS